MGHKNKLCHSRPEVRNNVFRIVQNWNSLSEGTVAATTLNIFKMAGNDICRTISVKSRIPDRIQSYILYFGILVSMLL